MARQCTKPKRPKNSEWFKEKMLLAQALEARVVLDEEQMAFLADCDEAPSASSILMAKLFAYDSDILLEVPNLDTYQANNNVIDQSMQEMQYSKQPDFINESDIDTTSDSNIISYDQYLKETKNKVVQDTTSSVQQDAMIMFVIEETSNQIAKCNEVNKVNKTVNESLIVELKRNKEQIKIFEERQKFDLTNKEKYIDGQIRVMNNQMDVLMKEFSKKQDKYIEEIVDLEKKKKALDNIVYKIGQTAQTMHMLTKPQVFYDEAHKTALGSKSFVCDSSSKKTTCLYCGHKIVKKHDALFLIDIEETLKLDE
ncbi:hypothetical protein Tco_0828012 [Tanacetum coccineum]